MKKFFLGFGLFFALLIFDNVFANEYDLLSYQNINDKYLTVNITPPTCFMDGQVIKKNSKGIKKVEAIKKGHSWSSSYVIDVYPTYNKTGIMSIYCDVCGARKPNSSVTIPKLSRTATIKNKVYHVGKKVTYKYKKPKYNNMKIKYFSSNNKIAYVNSSGVITFYKVGKVKIYAKTGGVTNEILNIKVVPGNIKVKAIGYGNKIKIKYNSGKNAKKYVICRSTSKNGKYRKIASTSNLYYYDKHIIKEKNYFYKVKVVNGKYYYFTSPVKANSISKRVYLNKSYITMGNGSSYNLNLVNTSRNVTWKSLDKSVVTVSSKGVVSAKSKGSAYVVATVGSKKYKCLVVVTKPTIKLNASKVVVTERLTSHLVANVSGKSKKVVWKSSDSSIVTVGNNGNFQGQKPGTAVITATANNVSAKTTVVVKKYDVKKELDKFDLSKIDNLMFVAHPDDDVIWGGAHLIRDNFLVVNVTAGCVEYRGNEFRKAMSMTNDYALPLGYTDMIDVNKVNKGSKYDWPIDYKSKITSDIDKILNYKKWKLVVTHNPEGEYGHIHHKYTNLIVTSVYKKNYKSNNLYYFGYYFNSNASKYLNDTKISDNEFNKKNNILSNAYSGQTKTINVFRHMNRFENWVNSENWNSRV